MTLKWYLEMIVRATSRHLGHHRLNNHEKSYRYNALRIWLENRCVSKFDQNEDER